MNSGARRRIHCLRPLRDLPTVGTAETDRRPEHAHAAGECEASISRAMVRLLRARTGKGPSKARTALSSDLAIVTLGATSPKPRGPSRERAGARSRFGFAPPYSTGLRAEAVAAVEALTGRQVAAYLTAHEHDPDLAIIAFHFAPAAGTL